MRFQIECFANSCEDLIFKYLPFLSDRDFQRKEWFEKKHPQWSCVYFVESFLSDLKHLFTTAEYKYYEMWDAMILLRELNLQVWTYYTTIETACRLDNCSLLEDAKWVEIQELAYKAEIELKKFISVLERINMNDKSLIYDLFGKMLSLEARDVKLGYGSFITMGFGDDDIAYEITLRGKMEVHTRPEWYLWVYMCEWELEVNGEEVAYCEDDRDFLREAIKVMENKKLLKVEVLSDTYDLQLDFAEDVTLRLISNLEEDYEQWRLFTPERKTLVAGPYEVLSYEPSGE